MNDVRIVRPAQRDAGTAQTPGMTRVAGVSAAALSFVLFLNPTANWYALGMAFIVAAVLAWTKPGDRGRLVWIGAMIGTTFLLRQLSGPCVAWTGFR